MGASIQKNNTAFHTLAERLTTPLLQDEVLRALLFVSDVDRTVPHRDKLGPANPDLVRVVTVAIIYYALIYECIFRVCARNCYIYTRLIY